MGPVQVCPQLVDVGVAQHRERVPRAAHEAVGDIALPASSQNEKLDDEVLLVQVGWVLEGQLQEHQQVRGMCSAGSTAGCSLGVMFPGCTSP
jgi:hypothetical protein